MLLTLNEDCLIHLCGFLNVEDQIALCLVNRHLHDFFVYNFWNCKQICLNRNAWYGNGNEPYFPKLMSIVAEAVEEFHFNHKAILGLDDIKFPNVKCVVNPNYFRDADISQMFPNIKELCCKTILKSTDLSLLKQLENLTVHGSQFHCFEKCDNFPNLKQFNLKSRPKWVRNCCPAFKKVTYFPTLEEVGFAEVLLTKYAMKILKKLENLQTINLWVWGYHSKVCEKINQIETDFKEVIDTLAFCALGSFEPGAAEILQLKSLRCIVFYKTVLNQHDFEQMCRHLPETLEEFHYLYCSLDQEEDASSFLHLISSCLNLRLLDVTGNNIRQSFVAQIANALDIQNRKQSFVLRCFQTKITKDHLQGLDLPANMQVSLSKGGILDSIEESCKFVDDGYIQLRLDRSKKMEMEETNEEEDDSTFDNDVVDESVIRDYFDPSDYIDCEDDYYERSECDSMFFNCYDDWYPNW